MAREEKKIGRPPPEAYTRVNLGCNVLSLARALLRMVGARQGSSQHGRSMAVAAGGLVSSQTYKDLVECADDTAETKTRRVFFLRHNLLAVPPKTQKNYSIRFLRGFYGSKPELLSVFATCTKKIYSNSCASSFFFSRASLNSEKMVLLFQGQSDDRSENRAAPVNLTAQSGK